MKNIIFLHNQGIKADSLKNTPAAQAAGADPS